MKKIILPIFVALMATFTFSSCEKETEMTDSELAGVLTGSTYSAKKSADVEETIFFPAQESAVWTDVILDIELYKGPWNVTGGKVTIADPVNGSVSLEITKDGKELIAPDEARTIYTKK